jgi:hypothetical protein
MRKYCCAIVMGGVPDHRQHLERALPGDVCRSAIAMEAIDALIKQAEEHGPPYVSFAE